MLLGLLFDLCLGFCLGLLHSQFFYSCIRGVCESSSPTEESELFLTSGILCCIVNICSLIYDDYHLFMLWLSNLDFNNSNYDLHLSVVCPCVVS